MAKVGTGLHQFVATLIEANYTLRLELHAADVQTHWDRGVGESPPVPPVDNRLELAREFNELLFLREQTKNED